MKRSSESPVLGGLVLGLVTVCLHQQARGLTWLARWALEPSVVAVPARKSVQLVSASTPRRASAAALLERNPFDSTTGSLNGVEEDTGGPTFRLPFLERLALDPARALPCEGVRLLAVSESPDPFWSLATLRVDGAPGAMLRRLGDVVLDRRVVYIGDDPLHRAPSVFLAGNAPLCRALLFAPPPATTEHGERTDRIAFSVDRSVLFDARAQILALQSARFVGNRMEGLRFLGVKPGSLLERLGLRSGDELEAIDGLDLHDGPKALAGLATASRLTVRVRRGAERVQIDYLLD